MNYLERLLSTPGILHFKEKHGERFFVCGNKQEFCQAAMKVLRDRLEDDYWYFGKEKIEAQKISDSTDLEAAFEFLDFRKDYEYEDFTIERSEEY